MHKTRTNPKSWKEMKLSHHTSSASINFHFHGRMKSTSILPGTPRVFKSHRECRSSYLDCCSPPRDKCRRLPRSGSRTSCTNMCGSSTGLSRSCSCSGWHLTRKLGPPASQFLQDCNLKASVPSPILLDPSDCRPYVSTLKSEGRLSDYVVGPHSL